MKIKTGRTFVCHCDKGKSLPLNQLAKHLKTVHGLEYLKGNRMMTTHLDCADHYTSVYEWRFETDTNGETVVVTETFTAAREFDPFWSMDL